MTFESNKEASRKCYGRHNAENSKPTEEQIKLGALQRIADAAELMAKNYAALVAERNAYQRSRDGAWAEVHRLERRIRSLRGVITRMRNRAGK